MKKDKLERMLEAMMSTGADFAEVYVEDKKTTIFNYIDSNLDSYSTNFSNGVGLRICLLCFN